MACIALALSAKETRPVMGAEPDVTQVRADEDAPEARTDWRYITALFEVATRADRSTDRSFLLGVASCVLVQDIGDTCLKT